VVKLPLNTGSAKGLHLWLSPVFYLGYEGVEKYFLEMIQNLHGLISNVLLTAADRKVILSVISSMLVMSAVSLKHEGFREEKEWRVIYIPENNPASPMLKGTEICNGVPQIVYKLPLKNNPAEGVVGIEIPQLVDRVIIGPSAYPEPMREAFVVALQEAGMTDAKNRVVCSGIPLRT
jgi:hypothetical protein